MTQPFEAEDLFRYKSIPEIHACPNSNHFSCCIEAIDQAEDATVSKLWILSLNGAEPRQMTTGASNDFQPRWSADGSRLGFISDREGSTQVFYIPRDGGEARQATHFDGKIVSFRWHPGAEELLVIASVAVDPNLRGRRSIEKAPQAGEDAPQVIWKLPYKADGTGYTLNRETHLFTVDLATAETSQLTDGAFDVRSAEWSPNGERIAYVRTREGDEAHRSDLWVIDADGSAAQQLTSVQAQALFPVWSPDGKWIVFSGTIAEGDAQVRLWMVDVDSEGVDALGDESIEMSTEGDSVQFTADGSHIVAIVAHRGVQNVAEISVPDGTLRWITRGDRQIQNVAISGDRLIYASVTPTSPIELFCCKSPTSIVGGTTVALPLWSDVASRCRTAPEAMRPLMAG
jgi:dipeptidyl aminopeptidase/acylaminoacyl peptidase